MVCGVNGMWCEVWMVCGVNDVRCVRCGWYVVNGVRFGV